jgi:hypothetical protein
MARRHPDRTANRTTDIRRPRPSAPAHPSTPASRRVGLRWVSNPGRRASRVRVARGPRADICRRRRGNHQRTHCEPRMRQQSARPAESHIGGTQTFSLKPWLSVHRQWSLPALRSRLQPIEPRTRRGGASHIRPPDLRTVSCRADATYCGDFRSCRRPSRTHRFDQTDDVHIDGAHHPRERS